MREKLRHTRHPDPGATPCSSRGSSRISAAPPARALRRDCSPSLLKPLPGLLASGDRRRERACNPAVSLPPPKRRLSEFHSACQFAARPDCSATANRNSIALSRCQPPAKLAVTRTALSLTFRSSFPLLNGSLKFTPGPRPDRSPPQNNSPA